MRQRNVLYKIIIAACLVASCLSSQVLGQKSIDLSGTWQFRYDPSDYGQKEEWHKPGPISWNTTETPSSFNTTDNRWYSGAAWYRTSFQVPEGWTGGRLFLRFLGCNIRCQVWVNGEPVGAHRFPYLPFELDITGSLRPDTDNWLVVRVDNRIEDRAIPDRNWDGWWNYGGIIREVYLEHRPALHIDDASVKTSMMSTDRWKLKVAVDTENLSGISDVRMEVTIREASGKLVWEGNRSERIPEGTSRWVFERELRDVESWSPASPSLYTATVTIKSPGGVSHEYTARFGFRQIETRGTRIYLNGEPILIKGISYHEMHPEMGMTLTDDQRRRDMKGMQALGVNMIRTAHYGHHPDFFKLADEMGFLVWTEIPAWKTSTTSLMDPKVWELYGAPQLRALVDEFKNHPSVIIWSVGNEFNSDSEEGAAYVRRAVRFVRDLDSTRLITFASDEHRSRDGDRSYDYVDLIGINEYYGWYYGTMHDIGPTLDRLHRLWPDKPVLVAEVGSGSLPTLSNPNPADKGKDYSTEYHKKFLSTHLNQIFAPERRGFVAGALVWLYNDFPDPHRVGSEHPVESNYVNSKGLVTQDRREKPAFETVKKIFGNLPDIK